MSAGLNLRKAVEEEVPLQVAGTINAYCARLAERAGFKGLYLSGAGTANASFGLPDLGITTLNDVCEDVRRITATTQVPLLVDADTGWGSAFNIARTVRDLTRAGAAGCHLEDQEQAKRCGHRPNKALVSCGRNGESNQGCGRCAHRRSICRDGAHRRGCFGRGAGRDRPGSGVRRGRCGHDFR